MKLIDLDNSVIYKQLDQYGMLRHLQDVPELVREAWHLAMSMNFPPDYRHVNRIAILGMGGSAIGGDLLSSVILDESPVPVTVHRSYTLPAFVDEHTLVIASSYSGMTEETLSAFQQALRSSAKSMVMTTGGRLKELAEEHGIPIFSFDYKSPPRAALYLNFIALVGIMQNLGFIADKTSAIGESCNLLDDLEHKLNPNVSQVSNTGKQLAVSMSGKMVVVYGAEFLSEVAHRWKAQINENAKTWAFCGALPEINHNAVSGYQFPVETASKTLIVMLDSPLLHERIRRRYSITISILEQVGIKYQKVEAMGISPIAQMTGLMLLGDYASYYLAMLNGVDPYLIKDIDFLKTELAKDH
jgi:glucose/mannose-6-phosphate isomerase